MRKGEIYMYYPQSNHIIEVDDITNVQHVYVTLEDGKPILYIKASLDPRKDYLHKKLAKTAHIKARSDVQGAPGVGPCPFKGGSMRKTVVRSHATPMLSHPPALPYRQCQFAYFIHGGAAHNVATSPSAIFKDWIAALPPMWPSDSAEDAEKLLKAREIDLEARWWLLCMLGKAKCPLRIYESKDEAMRALWCGHDVGRFCLIVQFSRSARL